MGNRDSIKCWKDHWIPRINSLTNFIPDFANLDLGCFLKDMVLNNDTWNLDLFRVWVPEEVILRIHPVYPNAGTDMIIWRLLLLVFFLFVELIGL